MDVVQFPSQQLPMHRKTKEWRKKCVDFADSRLRFNYNAISMDMMAQRVNYDLLNGKLHMDDLQLVCNPEGIKAGFIPDKIQHYPIINSKLHILQGEEAKRPFDPRVVVTNPTAISEVEEAKKKAVYQSLQDLIQQEGLTEEEYQDKLEQLENYYTYTYQDYREVWGNCVLKHYMKELNVPIMFNDGIMDALAVAEEAYHCDIVGGEPYVEKLRPSEIRAYRTSYSNKLEDADMIILESYWSPGRIIDYYAEDLTAKDLKSLEEVPYTFSQSGVDAMDNIDPRPGLINSHMLSDVISDTAYFFDPTGEYTADVAGTLMPYDNMGNIRVMRVYWKSRKKIKKIKRYDPETGEEEIAFRDENYIIDRFKGEEEESVWVNEAWEGVKIGKDIYVRMGPRKIQYNRASNPSRCHFGIIGSIYNLNDSKPFSMVDMMKPYSYLYDVIHDRLNKMMARNWGKMARLDLSKKPKTWKMEKWLYYARALGLYVENSFNEGESGIARGVMAGSLNSNTQGVIDADFGANIQQYINLGEYIKQEMAEVVGISKQREGQISNRETVGGVERATLQSSHITEWVFTRHDDVKRRVLEAFLETAKIAFRGRKKKFEYITPDYGKVILEIDGDVFAECDFGLVIDLSTDVMNFQQQLETLAQAALQNQALSFSTIMRLYSSASLAEKQRFIEADERRIKKEAQQAQQAQQQQLQQQAEMQQQTAQAEMQMKDLLNQRDNETKIAVAEINSQAEMAILRLKNDMVGEEGLIQEQEYSPEAKDRLMLEMKKLDAEIQLKKDTLEFQKQKTKKDQELKEKQIKAQAARRASQK